jgi:hypothetical protein
MRPDTGLSQTFIFSDAAVILFLPTSNGAAVAYISHLCHAMGTKSSYSLIHCVEEVNEDIHLYSGLSRHLAQAREDCSQVPVDGPFTSKTSAAESCG